jgi:small-conductance mechanosensitive channel
MGRRNVDPITRARNSNWVKGIVSGAVAIAALVLGSEFGGFHQRSVREHVIGWSSAVIVIVFGVYSVQCISSAIGSLVTQRTMPAAGAAARLLATGVGYVIVLFSVFGVLGVSISHLLLGVGLAGVVLGIAAQQSLGNMFAAIVLVFARPFVVGDRIRIRSGPLGGVLDVTVIDIGLTYVTVMGDEGELKVPNAAMLAAGIGQLDPTPPGRPVQPPAALEGPIEEDPPID